MSVASESSSLTRVMRERHASSGTSNIAASTRSREDAYDSSRAPGASRRGERPSSSAPGARRLRSNQSPRDVVGNVGIPIATATLGCQWGATEPHRTAARTRAVGHPGAQQSRRQRMSGMARQIDEFGQQLCKLASEVRAVRDKAEQIGRVIN
jgi:hypothetical protein